MVSKKARAGKNTWTAVAFSVIAAATIAQGAESTTAAPPNFSESNAEWHFVNGETDKLRLNLFLNLPKGIRSYSFMEFKGEQGYYGKNQINIPTYIPAVQKLMIDIKAESKHMLGIFSMFGNTFTQYYNTIGFGLEKGFLLPGYSYLSIKFLPAVLGKDGLLEDNMVAGYFLNVNLFTADMLELKLMSYIDVNVAGKDFAGESGPIWDYGENHITAFIKTAYGKFFIGGGVNHDWSGEFEPKNHAVVKIGYHVVK